MNDPQKTPHSEATSRGPTDRPAQWILDLGLEIEAGRRPWLRPLVAAVLVLGLPVILRTIGGLEHGEPARDPDLVAFTDRLTSLATVLAVVLAGVFVVSSVGYWFLCRYAHAAWRSLPEDERDAVRRERVEQLRRAIVALGGDDPDELTIRAEDLEDLSGRHRHLLEDLRACSRRAAEPICAGARARTDDLVMAGRLHRALSKDTIVRPPDAVNGATDPRVLALVELDEEIQAEATAIRESLETGRCNCDQGTHERLVRAGDRAHARLHGLDPEDPNVQGSASQRPRWVGRLIWTGVAITIAALPIGLLTEIPSVVISVLGMTATGAGFLAANHQAGADATPSDRLLRRLVVIAWLAGVTLATVALLA